MSDAMALGRRAPEQRQAAVVDAARTLFLSRGVAQTSIDAIAKQAGVAKGSVYLYFATKEHIIKAIEAQFNARILQRTHAAAAATASRDADAAVTAWCEELVHAYLDELDVHDMLFYSGAAATRQSAADNSLIDDLSVLLAAHGASEPSDTAAFLVAGVTALTDRAILEGRTNDRGALVRTAARLVAATTRMSKS